MLPGATVPRSLADLLAVFRPCFTAPTFPTFIGLLVGLIAQTRRRTVCGMLTGAGLDQVWHHSRAHRMFANARWSGDALGLGALLTFLWVLFHDRPGSGGQRPPRVRSAMAISASGLW